jgi:DMSO/TMAO reductase YedYZ molybdopterin-dependent catalytic subunit/nitrite reductase/ring-hydroxylating ferredoxin subunit
LSNKRGYIDNPERMPSGWHVAPVERWPINNPNSGDPNFDIEKWRFRAYGEVENPLELTYDEFQKLPHVSKILDHHCVDGWSYLGQLWNGVDISIIKEISRVKSSARYVLAESSQGLSQRFPIDQDLLLADGQNGSVLTRPTGYPLRIVAPGEFGYKSTKWVDKVKFCAEPELDYLDIAFTRDGLYESYSQKISNVNPWTVDNNERKDFLRKNFAADTARARVAKREAYRASSKNNLKPKDSETFFPICELSTLKENAGTKFVVNGSEVLVIKAGHNRVHAVEPICTHIGSDLSHGKVNLDAKTLKCPLHGAMFDISTGSCLNGPYGCDGGGFPGIRTYQIKLENGTVFLQRNQEWGSIW